MMDAVDIAGLVEAGHLDLDAVFGSSDWSEEDDITAYTARWGGDVPSAVDIALEEATEYGITAYRWAARDSDGPYEWGTVTLDRAGAIRAGKEYASEHADEEPDADDLIRLVVETGYFGDADADDIRAICEEATEYSQGYLMLPAGEFPGRPLGRLWTTNAYLQRDDYVTLDATHSSVAYAADALLRAVTSSGEE